MANGPKSEFGLSHRCFCQKMAKYDYIILRHRHKCEPVAKCLKCNYMATGVVQQA